MEYVKCTCAVGFGCRPLCIFVTVDAVSTYQEIPSCALVCYHTKVDECITKSHTISRNPRIATIHHWNIKHTCIVLPCFIHLFIYFIGKYFYFNYKAICNLPMYTMYP